MAALKMGQAYRKWTHRKNSRDLNSINSTSNMNDNRNTYRHWHNPSCHYCVIILLMIKMSKPWDSSWCSVHKRQMQPTLRVQSLDSRLKYCLLESPGLKPI